MTDAPKIITDGLLGLKAYQTMRLWTDAYTARLEAVVNWMPRLILLGVAITVAVIALRFVQNYADMLKKL